MESRTKAIFSFAILIVLLFGLYFFADWFSKTTGYVLGEDEKTKLAQCLGSKGSVLYVSETCPDCEEQKELFGEDAIKFIKIVECKNVEQQGCENGVPVWKIEGKIYQGVRELNDLVKISGCELS